MRPRLLVALSLVVVVTGCTGGPSSIPVGVVDSVSSASAAPVSDGDMAAPPGCAVRAVQDRLGALVSAINDRDGQRAAEQFTSGPQLDLRDGRAHTSYVTAAEIAALVDRLRAPGRPSWQLLSVVAGGAAGSSGSTGVFVANVTSGGTSWNSKVVVDCESGLVQHLVGPSVADL